MYICCADLLTPEDRNAIRTTALRLFEEVLGETKAARRFEDEVYLRNGSSKARYLECVTRLYFSLQVRRPLYRHDSCLLCSLQRPELKEVKEQMALSAEEQDPQLVADTVKTLFLV